MGAARQQRWAPAPVALPSFAPELQPLRLLVAPPVGQLVLALRDGRSLYACDVSAESTRGGQPAAAALLSHHEPPVCALTFIRQRGRLFLVALQEDAAVCAWYWSTAPVLSEWRPLNGGSGTPLVLPGVQGLRGSVLDACLCAPAAATAQPSADLVWLLHRPESDHTELLLRRVPLDLADNLAAGSADVQRLGTHAAARRLLCSSGGDLWVWTAGGIAHRWCLRAGVCVARQDMGDPPHSRAPVAALHHPSRELVVCAHDGALLAVGPALRACADVDDGFANSSEASAPVVRKLGSLCLTQAPVDMVVCGPLCVVLTAAATPAGSASTAAPAHFLSVYHVATGMQVAECALPAADGSTPHVVAFGADVFLWRREMGTATCSLWRVAPSPSAALAKVAHRLVTDTSSGSADAVLLDAVLYGGSLEQVHASAALGVLQHAARVGNPTDVAAVVGHPSLRSLVPTAAVLVAQGAQDSSSQAAAWEKVTGALKRLHDGTEDMAASFRAYTPVGAAMARALRVGSRQDDLGTSNSAAAAVSRDAVAAAVATAKQFLEGQPATWLGWKQAGLAVAFDASQDSVARKDAATGAAVELFVRLVETRSAMQPVCDVGECSVCATQSLGATAQRIFQTPAGHRNAFIAAALARATRCDWDGLDSAAVWDAPPFESVCLCLASSLPGVLPVYVRACAALPSAPGGAARVLALRALRVLPRATCPCAAASRAATAAHAELLCVAGHQPAGMWLALHPSALGQQPDWHLAVRLLERESASSGASALLVVPLMFEVFAARVCDALVPGVNADEESEALAACVAHLFIAAKTVAALIKREGTTTHSRKAVAEPAPSVLDALHDVVEQAVLAWRQACTSPVLGSPTE